MTAPLARLTRSLADRYRLEHELGAGGMATVYLAHDLRHERDVAIKVLHPDLGAALGGERFLSEIRTTARLQHPHILPLLDSGDADGLLYYVMPLVTGETLRARLVRERQLPIADALRIAGDVASALDYAHRQGVIHRDIKPENILLHDGSALVADFGIALAVQSAGGGRLTQTGLSLGTPQYMSPEQAMGERTIDARSDVYALGAVTYEMLTGDPPFTGSSVQAVVAKVISASVERPSLTRKAVSPGIEAAVLRALEKLPADRFGSAAEFAAALQREPTTMTITGAARAASTPASRVRLATMTLAALMVGGVGGWLARGDSAPPGGALPNAALRPSRLTHDGRVGCAAVAPDGRQFALVTGSFSDETECGGTLVVRPMPTGPDLELARVSRVTDLRWNPAGDALVFQGQLVGKASGLWIIPTRSGTPRLLSTFGPFDVGFLADGQVFVVSRDPSAPDGDRVAMRLRVLDAQSGEVRDSLLLRTASRSRVLLSPSGRLLLYTSATSDALLLLSRSGQVVDSVISPGALPVSWIGDSAILTNVQPDWRPGDLVMRRVDAERGRFVGSSVTLLASVPEVRSVSVDRATGTVMWVSRAVTDELTLMSLPNATDARVLTRSLNAYLGDPVFSPDGQRLAYTRQDALGSNAYSVDIRTGVETPLTNDTLPTTNVDWPAAQQLIRSWLHSPLHVLDVLTGRSRSLALPAGERFVAAAGNTRLMERDTDRRLVWRDSLLQHPRAIVTPAGLDHTLDGALSRDGTSLLLVGSGVDGRPSHALLNTATFSWSSMGPFDTLTMRITNLAKDGTAFFTRFTDRTEMWQWLPGRPRARLTTLPVQCYEGSVTVSDDGSRVACNVTTNRPDVWVMTLPRAER